MCSSTLIATLGILILAWPAAAPASAATAAPSADTSFASLLNGLRTTLGLSPLTLDGDLSNIARTWSAQMADSGRMSHNPALQSQAKGWSRIGENVAYGAVANLIFAALAASPVHLRNMSDPEFSRIGIGSAIDGQGRLWTTHVFVRPAAAGPAPRPTTTAGPTTRALVAAPPAMARPTPTTSTLPTTTTLLPTTVGASTVPAGAPALPRATAGSTPGELSVAVAVAAAPVSLPALAPASSSRRQGVPVVLLTGVGILIVLFASVGWARGEHRRGMSR